MKITRRASDDELVLYTGRRPFLPRFTDRVDTAKTGLEHGGNQTRAAGRGKLESR